jgi:chemotaxis protein MotA
LDISTIGGLLIGWGGLVLAILWEGDWSPHVIVTFFNPSAFMLIALGTFGATVIGFPWSVTKGAMAILKKAFMEEVFDPRETITMMVGFATKARREGLLGLEEDIAGLSDPFLKKGLQLVVDGTEMEMVRNILENDLSSLETRHKMGESYFGSMGGYAPTLGIIGTVAGLVHALYSITDPSKLSGAIAVAFLATFYGISSANLIFLPLSSKLKVRSHEEIMVRTLMIEGVLSISAGDNPRIVEEKLKAYLNPKTKAAMEAAAAAGEAAAAK